MNCEGCTRQNCYECGYRYGMMLKEIPAQEKAAPCPGRKRAQRRRKQHRVLVRTVSILICTVLMACALVHAVDRVEVPELSQSQRTSTAQPAVTLDVKVAEDPQIEIVPLVHKEPAKPQMPYSGSCPEPAAEQVAEEKFTPLPVNLDAELQAQINDMCETYGVPFELIMAMCFRESSFDSGAISVTNDYGLLQINVINHEWLRRELGVTDFLDPLQNVECGLYILSDYIEQHGDLNLALMCYNCGADGAAKLWTQGIYSTPYSRETIRQMEEYITLREEG